MKKIRKLGTAVGAALLAGATITTASANLSDYPQPFIDQDGNIASSIVVGEDAKTNDVVSAINIAGSLGNSAYTAEPVQGSVTVDGQMLENNIRSSVPSATLDASDYSRLQRKNIQDDDGNDHFTVEEASVNSNTLTSRINGTQDALEVSSGALSYSVSYTPGFDVGDELELLGTDYRVTGVTNDNGDTVKLGSEKVETGLTVGDSISHGPYTIEVVDKDESNSAIYLRVSKDETVLKSKGLNTGESLAVEGGTLNVTADSVFFGSQKDYIDLTSTFTNLQLTEGEAYSKDSNYNVKSIKGSGFSQPETSGTVTEIVLESQQSSTVNQDEPNHVQRLSQDDALAGPEDYFSFTYQGLTNEATEQIKFKDEYKVSYTDSGGFEHTLDISTVDSSSAATLTTTNPWSGATDPVAFIDGGSGTWNPGTENDIILQDFHNGGTVSRAKDTALNTGSNSAVDSSDGDAYSDMSSITSGTYFVVSADGTFDAGEDVVQDDDNDGSYTGSADTLVGGTAPAAATSVTTANAQDTDWSIDSIDVTDGGAWTSSDTLHLDEDQDDAYTLNADTVVDNDGTTGQTDYGATLQANAGDAVTGAETVSIAAGGTDAGNELYYVDSDTSGGYSSTDEIVLEPNAENATSLTLDASTGTSEDGDGPDGDDTILSYGSDDTNGAADGDTLVQFTASDNVAFEDAGTEGTDNGQYESGEDIVVDAHNGGTISAGQDTVVGGATPSDGATGAQYTNNGFDADWSLDSIDATDADSWDQAADAIIIDTGDRGTYSDSADTMVNNGGSTSASDGTNLVDINGLSSLSWVNINGANGYDAGDEIFTDDDSDSVYTAQADSQIAGDALTTFSAGTSVQTGNPWSGASAPVTFIDGGDNVWQTSDSIVQDNDDSATYNSGDSVLAGATPTATPILDETQSSKEVYTDVSGRPVKVSWDASASEVTFSYKQFQTSIAPGETVNQDTGYGFTLDAEFQDGPDGDSDAEMTITGSDSTLDTRYGADVFYDSGNDQIEFDEQGNGFAPSDSDGQDFAITYSSNAIQDVSTDGLGALTSKDTVTGFGSVVETSDVAPVTVTYPENQRKAQSALGSTEGASTETINTPTGFPNAAALDSEIDTPEKDLILVGGPAVNTLTAELADQGRTWNASQYEANQGVGVIDLVEGAFSDHSALVVAGHQADDTNAAADFLADYREHPSAFEGKSALTVDTAEGEVVE